MTNQSEDPHGRAARCIRQLLRETQVSSRGSFQMGWTWRARTTWATRRSISRVNKRIEVSRLLLEAGAPVDPMDAFGNTPLWRAAFAFQGGDPELIRRLLDAGADPDRKNHSDRSPRDMAVTFDRPGIRALLG